MKVSKYFDMYKINRLINIRIKCGQKQAMLDMTLGSFVVKIISVDKAIGTKRTGISKNKSKSNQGFTIITIISVNSIHIVY